MKISNGMLLTGAIVLSVIGAVMVGAGLYLLLTMLRL